MSHFSEDTHALEKASNILYIYNSQIYLDIGVKTKPKNYNWIQ